MPSALKRTSLYDEHCRLGARMVEFAGFEMPIQYSGIKLEHQAVRQAAGLFDVSHMGELRVTGPGALSSVNRLITNDLTALKDGKALYTFCCNERGGILDDLIVYRLSESEIFVVCNASNREKIATHFSQQLGDSGCEFRDETDATALLAVQGPLAVARVSTLTRARDLESLATFAIRGAQIAGISCQVARTGYTGEDGLEIFCAWDDAPHLFRALSGAAAGQTPLAMPVGLAARDTLRLEARLLLYGNDMDESCTPYETGFGWVVKLNKGDFVGKGSLERMHTDGPARRLVGFEMLGRGIARPGYSLLSAEGEVIGRCTSGSPSPTLGTAIGLGYVPTAFATIDTPLQVDCRGKLIEARVVKTPFYQRQR